MSSNEFLTLCHEYTILPEVALDNEAVVYALMWAKKTTNHETAVAIVRNALEGNF
jgi:hypothetical protein